MIVLRAAVAIFVLGLAGCVDWLLTSNLGGGFKLRDLGDYYHELRFEERKVTSGLYLGTETQHHRVIVYFAEFADEVCGHTAGEGFNPALVVFVSQDGTLTRDAIPATSAGGRRAQTELREFQALHPELFENSCAKSGRDANGAEAIEP